MFWNNFYNECKKKNISPSKVASEINLSSGTVTKWKKGQIPNGETLIEISKYLNVSIDYLLEINTNTPGTDPDELQLLTHYRATDQKGKDRIRYAAEVEANRVEQEEKEPKRISAS